MDWLNQWGQTRKPPPWAIALIDDALKELEPLTRADENQMLVLRDRLTAAMLEQVQPASVKNYFTMLHRAIRIYFSPESGRLTPENSYQRSDHTLDPIACLLVDVPPDIKRQNRADQDAALEKILNNPSADRVLTDPDGIVQCGRDLLEGAIADYHAPSKSSFYLDIAASLCLLTGMRPVEVLRDAVLDAGHSRLTVQLVAGQAKTRGQERIYEMPTLIEGEVVLNGFHILRSLHDFRDYATDNMIQKEQNKLRDRVADLFTGVVPVPTPQHLRAVYDAIAYFWFCPAGVKEPAFIRAINGHVPHAGKVGAALNYLKYEIGPEAIRHYGGAKGVRLSEVGVEVIQAFRKQAKMKPIPIEATPVPQHPESQVQRSPQNDYGHGHEQTSHFATEGEPSAPDSLNPPFPSGLETMPKPTPAQKKIRNAILSRSVNLLSGTWTQRAIALQLLTGLSIDQLLHAEIQPDGLHHLVVDGVSVPTLTQQLMPAIAKFRLLPQGERNIAALQEACDQAFGDLMQINAPHLSLLYLAYASGQVDAPPEVLKSDADLRQLTLIDNQKQPEVTVGPSLPPVSQNNDANPNGRGTDQAKESETKAEHSSDVTQPEVSNSPSQAGQDSLAIALTKAVDTIHSLNRRVSQLEQTLEQFQGQKQHPAEKNQPPETSPSSTAQESKLLQGLQQENKQLKAEITGLRQTLADPQKLVKIMAQLMSQPAPSNPLTHQSTETATPSSEPTLERVSSLPQTESPQASDRAAAKSIDAEVEQLFEEESDLELDPQIVRAFDLVMAYNDAPERTQQEKWVLSYPVMKELLGTIGKNSQRKIVPVMNAKQDELEAHYRKHRLSKRHNVFHSRNKHVITDFVKL